MRYPLNGGESGQNWPKVRIEDPDETQPANLPPRWNNAEILAAMESLDRLFQRLEAAHENK